MNDTGPAFIGVGETAVKLLIVDDDPIMRRLLQATLSRAGHDLEQAENGQTAWDRLQQDPIRLVITDWMMPGLDGPELIRRIRVAPSTGYTYIILLTARGDKSDVVGGLETGADDYLTKPFHPGELRARVSIGERILNLETSLKEARDQLEILATHDGLTELLNRRAIQAHATAEWSRVVRSGSPLSMVLLDIDHFKRFNDQYGHLIGDQVLRLAADIITRSKRSYDWVGRWGGEEFLLILPETTLSDAAVVAQRVLTSIAATPLHLPSGEMLDIRASLGVSSTVASMPSSVDALLQQADEALYRAKQAGRNQVCLFEAPTSST